MIEETACIYFKEKDLISLLENLPDNHYLRPQLQKAGENIFRW